jgi:hypothetical protein
MIRPFFNPFTGDIELIPVADAIESAAKVQEEFDLYGSAAVGDIIIPSTSQAETVEAISSNNYAGAAFGIVTEIVSPTRVKVLISGKLSGSAYQLSGLDFGKILYISPLGKMTTTAPSLGGVQRMGIALKSDTIFLLPSLDKLIRT